MQLQRAWRSCCVYAGVLLAIPAFAVTVEGEASYRERIMLPPQAFLVVTLDDSARADAPAIELASARTRLAGGPPYRWRLDYDERLLGANSRPTLRARIETPQGIWMTTDTVVTASTPAPVLQLRMAQVPADPCAGASTQAALNACAFESFLAASATMSEQLRAIEAALTAARRASWRQVQKAWLTYQTQTCQFEAGAIGAGSARQMVQWQCSARLTRQRTAELLRLTSCPEGDTSCPLPQHRSTP